ncbi:bifunctional heptose 7-phosphate kinase/heptose 1-phosphate adenyltransferase [Portibacter marinus]|uniref:bifunctional heptose 7-phosphate kinase/heptose 1-phosphate adenyltransferase n=1 Tax=Portibacter marinus TaxID=2898660 RepID=UPI001F48CFA4|nr:bifunctional ADP-heptose synthase [Portibacter marinus]
MKRERIEQLLQFSDVHVLVLGDIMLDEYIFGNTKRISPEAPVPVVNLEKRHYRLGGAANVAMNTFALGAKTSIIGLIGDDFNGRLLTSLTDENKEMNTFLIKDVGRKTTCKTRILAANQHLLRVDNEDEYEVDDEIVGKVESMLKYIHHNTRIDIIVMQDYNKGFFSPAMIRAVINWSKENGVKSALDPKVNHIDVYKGVDIFKPNLKEVKTYLGSEVSVNLEGLAKVNEAIQERLSIDMLILTLSAEGIYVANQEGAHWESTSVQSIVDVSGAGDTVMSLVALLYCNEEASIEEIAQLANFGGAAVCRIPGVAVVDKEMIMNVIEKVK